MKEPIRKIVSEEDIANNPELNLELNTEVFISKPVTSKGVNKGKLFLLTEEEAKAIVNKTEQVSVSKMDGDARALSNKSYRGMEIVGDITDVDVQGVCYKQFKTVTGETFKIHNNEAATEIVTTEE